MSKANDHGYVRVMTNYERKYEHQRVWEDANGPIPTGHHIHHLNGDTADNRLENLRCVTESEHRRLHASCYQEVGGEVLKRCTHCGQYKTLDQFSRGANNTMQGPCKPCKAAWARKRKAQLAARIIAAMIEAEETED